jgi:hypothetical protein
MSTSSQIKDSAVSAPLSEARLPVDPDAGPDHGNDDLKFCMADPKNQYPADMSQKEILALYTPGEQREILEKLEVLKVLGQYIGRDFKMPVELNLPGSGWHWNETKNHVRIDPKDLLEKPIEELRFIISHEGGHRRVTRLAEFADMKVIRQEGFPLLANAIEDCRMNNFVALADPGFRKQMIATYRERFKPGGEDDLAYEKIKLEHGFVPKHMLAAFGYMRAWFDDIEKRPIAIDSGLPEDVQQVLRKTLPDAEAAWNFYPSKKEADQGEALIVRYAEESYKILRDRIYPEFRKLLAQDRDEMQMEKLLQNQAQDLAEGNDPIPPELREKLGEEEIQELMEALQQAAAALKDSASGNRQGAPIPLDQLSEELKEKLRDYIESLPEDVRQALEAQAEAALQELGNQINQELEGKLMPEKEKKMQAAAGASGEVPEGPVQSDQQPAEAEEAVENEEPQHPPRPPKREESPKEDRFKQHIQEVIHEKEGVYQASLREVSPIVNAVEKELRAIFEERSRPRVKSGYEAGDYIDIDRRIEEIHQGISAHETRAWTRESRPTQRDYAITLLVDLSGSMRGEKISETFKAAVVLSEVLGRLGIKTEILGFNSKLHEFKKFSEKMGDNVRGKMGNMLDEVRSPNSMRNDDGWALTQASTRLGNETAKEKFLMVFSDGQPAPSPEHAGPEWELNRVVSTILKQTDQKLIGLGVGPGTSHVRNYFPNSLADINVQEMAGLIADLLKDVIVNHDRYRRENIKAGEK